MSYTNPEVRRAYEREWRRRKWSTDPEYRERKKATDRSWLNKRYQKIQAFKIQQGCQECGYNKCARALHFHHIDSKVSDVATLAKSCVATELVWAEIEKCIVLCANCHSHLNCKGCVAH